MASRRHDAHTTKAPQAFVPATVIPQTRCRRCTFFFLGPHGSLCPSCAGGGTPAAPVKAPTAPESPTTDATASSMITQALDALPPDLERRRQDLETRMAALERKIAVALEEVSQLRQNLSDLLDAEGGSR
jgi:hypothetical protein